MKVLFLGSSRFSKIILESLIKNGVNVNAIITQCDKPSGRGHKMTMTDVKIFGIQNQIDVYTFDKFRNHIDEVKNIDYDIAVVASYGQILPDDFLNHKLVINVHPSLLPKYRGATPIQSAILNGDTTTGVTIMKVAKEVDAGDIISQKSFDMQNEYYLELEEKLASIGADMLLDVLKDFENNSLSSTPQDGTKKILVSKVSKEDGIIDLDNDSKTIFNQVRALAENVGCYLCVGDEKIKIKTVVPVDEQVEQKTVADNKKRFIVGCKDGAVEILTCLSPSGKTVSGRDFLNGHNQILGKRL